MSSRDIRLEIDPQPTLRPQSASGAVTGLEVDLAGSEAAYLLIDNGAATTAATIQVQETDTTGSGYAAVADSDLLGLTGNTAGVLQTAATITEASYVGSKRFIRVSILTGASAALISTTVVRGHLRHAGGQPV